MQKIIITVTKIHEKLLQAELFLAKISTKLFGGWSFAQTPLGELTALPHADPLSVNI